MENENIKIENKTIWSKMSGGQKFCLGLVSAVLVIAFSVLAIKVSHMNFFNSNQVTQSVTSKTNEEKLTDKEKYRINLENQTAKKVQSVLEKIVGKDNVTVQVNAEIDFNSTSSTFEKYTPVGGNLSAKEIKQTVSAPGAIKRITVAVAVNKILTSKEKQELTDLIASASGVDFARGDAVSVSSLKFLGFDEAKADRIALDKSVKIKEALAFVVNDILPLIIILIVGIIALFVIKKLFAKTEASAVEYLPTKINYENDTTDNNEDNQQYQQTEADIEQIKRDLSQTILSNTKEAAKLLTSYIKE